MSRTTDLALSSRSADSDSVRSGGAASDETARGVPEATPRDSEAANSRTGRRGGPPDTVRVRPRAFPGLPGGAGRVIARDEHGELLLARREHVTPSRAGTTHGAWAHHVIRDGVSACAGALLLDGVPLSLLGPRQLCHRAACRNVWREARA